MQKEQFIHVDKNGAIVCPSCDGEGVETTTTNPTNDLSDEQIELAENLGSFLWESSTLRHGLFTPPEFSRLVRERIKQYFYEQNAACGGTDEAS